MSYSRRGRADPADILIPLVVVYWVIRLAVRHGNRDSKRHR